jgi:hypothetical protein
LDRGDRGLEKEPRGAESTVTVVDCFGRGVSCTRAEEVRSKSSAVAWIGDTASPTFHVQATDDPLKCAVGQPHLTPPTPLLYHFRLYASGVSCLVTFVVGCGGLPCEYDGQQYRRNLTVSLDLAPRRVGLRSLRHINSLVISHNGTGTDSCSAPFRTFCEDIHQTLRCETDSRMWPSGRSCQSGSSPRAPRWALT